MRGEKYILLFGLLMFFVGIQQEAFAQVDAFRGRERPSVTKKGLGSLDYKEKADRSIYFIKADTEGLLYGNPCVEEVAREMGFYYVIMPKTELEKLKQSEVFFHNLGTSLMLVLRNGPFWKIRFNRKRKQCKEKTGDFVG